MIIKKQSVETIRYALRFLAGVNETISHVSESTQRIEKALIDARKDAEALDDFESLLCAFREGSNEAGERVYFY